MRPFIQQIAKVLLHFLNEHLISGKLSVLVVQFTNNTNEKNKRLLVL